jgi:sulfite reductase alpha subunit-like flavoprotein
VYVCGDGTMAQDVDQMLCRIAMDGSQRTNAEAQSFLKDLQEQGRYLQDVWCKK